MRREDARKTPEEFVSSVLARPIFLLTGIIAFSIRSHILLLEGVQIATVIQTEQDAVLADPGDVPWILEALANGARH